MKMRWFIVLLTAGLLSALSASGLAAERVALVIGNAAYAHAPLLRNPPNDAEAISASLGRLGFTVTRLDDADKRELERGLQAFKSAASGSEIALVFYSGHGIEVDKRNFLVPVDARLASADDVEYEAVPLDLVMRAVGRNSGLGLVILDACRDNPFAAAMQRHGSTKSTRAIGKGLARVEPAGQMLVAYAAKEGQVAADGAGRNSPYTAALLAHVETPGLEIMQLFREVRDTVLESTGDKQEPFVYGSLSRERVYLTARAEPAPRPSTAVPPVDDAPASDRLTAEQLAAERVFWESVKDSPNAADVQAYVDKYPGGTYEVLARNRLEVLLNPAAPAATAPAPSPQANLEAAEAGLGLSRADRRLIQLGLLAEGFNVGKADGLIGNRTRAALRQWQASRGAAATGYLDATAAKALLASGEAAEPAHEPGTVFRDCAGCPEMVVVPAGSYMMGSPSGEAGRDDDEGPQHRVAIGEAFAVGVHEVTRGEFARFVSATGLSTGNSCRSLDSKGKWADVSGLSWRNPGFEQTDRHPVLCVSWEDAQAYVRWLSRETGKGYRLLSESEWEYVARGGTRTARYWGEGESGQCGHANGADLTAQRRHEGWTVASCDDGYYQTAPVGSFSPNGFGLYDVLGNAREWVEDCWNASYKGAPGDGRAWKRGYCSLRVVRGGSWVISPSFLRAAVRDGYTSGLRFDYLGFRIARTLTP